MNLSDTRAAYENAVNMARRYQEDAEKLAEKLSQMSVCEHNWSRDIAVLAEESGRDLSYFDAYCHRCDILKSETF